MYLFFIIAKYSGTEKPDYKLEYYRDKENIKYPPIIAGYLINKEIKQQHFIATVLDFVAKGYIKLEPSSDKSDYIFTIVKNIRATEIETTALEIFFNNELSIGLSQNLKQFHTIMRNEKIWGHYNSMKNYFNSLIRDFFNYSQEVKEISHNTNQKNIFICYIIFLISCFFLVYIAENIISNILILAFFGSIAFLIFLFILSIIKFSILGIFSWVPSLISICFVIPIFLLLFSASPIFGFFLFIIVVLMATIILFDDMLQRKTTSLANAYEMTRGLQKYIKKYSNINEYDLCSVYLWDQYYSYAVAFNIKKL